MNLGRPALLLGVIVAIDLTARFGGVFDFARAMHVEAILFPVAAVATAGLSRKHTGGPRWARAAQVSIAWLFAVGGVRPILWSFGVPLELANLVTLITGIAAAAISLAIRRVSQRPP